MSYLLQELRFTFRNIRRQPAGFSVIVITLALALGPALLILQSFDMVVSQAKMFPQSGRLILIDNPELAGIDIFDKAALLEAARSFRTIQTFTPFHVVGLNLTTASQRERITASLVGPDFLSILGVPPRLGRDFLPVEYDTGKDRVIILGDRFYRTHYTPKDSVLGRRLTLNGVQFVVMGVLPKGFVFPQDVDVYIPSALDLSILHNSGSITPYLIGRLSFGRSLNEARAELTARQEKDRNEAPSERPLAGVTPLNEALAEPFRIATRTLVVVALGLLLIAAMNVAFLTTLHGIVNYPSLSIRSALGASRKRLQLASLTYVAIVVFASAICGVVLAAVLLRAAQIFRPYLPVGFPLPSIGIQLLAVPVLLCFPCALLASIGPTLLTWNVTKNTLTPRTDALFPRFLRLGMLFTATATAALLLEVSGNVLSSTWRVTHSSLGFSTEGLATASVTLDGRRYRYPGVASAYASQVLQDVRTDSHVSAAAATSDAPLRLKPSALFAFVASDDSSRVVARVSSRFITPGYFTTMQMRLDGRDFSTRDTTTSPQVAILSADVAARLWPGRSPIGNLFHQQGSADAIRVVGIVPAVDDYGLHQPTTSMVYSPLAQNSWQELTFIIRTPEPLKDVSPHVRKAIEGYEPNAVAFSLMSMRDRLVDNERISYLLSVLTAALCAISLLLLVSGTYSITRYSADNRAKEFSVKLALGARRSSIALQLCGEATLIALGSAICGGLGSTFVQQVLGQYLGEIVAVNTFVRAMVPSFVVAAVVAGCVPSVMIVFRSNLTLLLRSER